jgi:hypothetical protein
VKCNSLSVEGFLENNDINATAACINVTRMDASSDDDSDNGSDALIDFDFHFAPEFWHFFLSSATERKLCAISLAAGSRSLVRLAFKSFEMGIPFSSKRLDGTAIDPSADPLFASHKEKIKAMQQWQDSPFRIMHIVTDTTSAGGGSHLKRIAQKANCSESELLGLQNRPRKQDMCPRILQEVLSGQL